jgi:DNA-directed RNA polymerase subunit K/omega
MSSRSELLFQAHGKISNPFFLCTLIGKRTRQLMMSRNRNQSTAEIVDYAFRELLAGALEFEMHGEKQPKSELPLPHGHLNAASREAQEVEAR